MNRPNSRAIVFVIAVGVACLGVVCCGLVGLVWLARSASPQPDHYGFYLRRENTLVEMQLYEGKPDTEESNGIPTTSGARPTLVIWSPAVDLPNLVLRSAASSRSALDYDVTPQRNGALEARPSQDLPPGRYCLIQGDPFGNPYGLSTWCFEVH